MKTFYFLRFSTQWVLLWVMVVATGCQLEETEFIQPVPVALDASHITSTGFTAAWKPVLGSNLYLVDVSTDPDFSNFVTGYQSREVAGTSLQITNLEAEQEYYYRVRARKGNTFSGNSNVIRISSSLLTAPVAFSATDNKVFQFTANWTLVDEAASYLVEVALDSAFTTTLPAYNGKEVVSNSLLVEGLDYRNTYYYRIKAKRLGKTSNYSNSVQVKPVISPNCKLSKILYESRVISQFNYDEQGRLVEILNDEYNGIVTVKIAYGGNGKASEVSFYSPDNIVYEKHKLLYNQQGLLITVNAFDEAGQFKSTDKYIYNDNQQLIGFRQYGDASGTEITAHETYEIDPKGNVLKILDSEGVGVAVFRYDDKFNPRMLIPQEVRQYASDVFQRASKKPYLRLNNFTYEQEVYYFDSQLYKSTEVFIHDYNEKDIALARNGFYSATYEFTGCDF